MAVKTSTLDLKDVARFDVAAEDWWDPNGSMRALHKFNPIRIKYLRDTLVRHYEIGKTSALPLQALRVLDIGCGAGLVAEPLARFGANVIGLDAAPRNIEVARVRAAAADLKIDYRCSTIEAFLEEQKAQNSQNFDAVLMLEVLEHVKNPGHFITNAAALVRPGGLLFAATLNRTLKSYVLAIVGAEYILGWVERGTHDWHQFMTPEELVALLGKEGLKISERVGLVYDPIKDKWRASHDLQVNYMIVARRPKIF
jgi:2-polyprenyl-6-hydroxyphenyl methylase/3-demethylubiquinone-9 3-methyltransferase